MPFIATVSCELADGSVETWTAEGSTREEAEKKIFEKLHVEFFEEALPGDDTPSRGDSERTKPSDSVAEELGYSDWIGFRREIYAAGGDDFAPSSASLWGALRQAADSLKVEEITATAADVIKS
eukprot:TRINITY_DN112644_c0_g1_i1.p2 TRINITY_DN112644_c0_g1~~TRINITY_DN112644_c0_g1_i1.p2  ORF type:complete len:124 (-),score=22.93 TRINITY_DN112644_c0_g1_i1:365-736(-)